MFFEFLDDARILLLRGQSRLGAFSLVKAPF